MLTRRSVISMLTIAAMILVAGVASGQNFPTKPIRILVGSAGGGNRRESGQHCYYIGSRGEFTARRLYPHSSW